MSRNRGLVSCLLGILAISVLTAVAYRLPNPRKGDAAGPELATSFSAYGAQTQLKLLVGDGVPHPIGSEANARVRATIVQRLTILGYQTEIQSGFVCNAYAVCGTPSNIIARQPPQLENAGSAQDAELVLLTAHYDSVPAGPGASDDAAGVAALLEIARILALMPPTRHRIAFLFSDGEEAGLLGALLFIREHPMAKRVFAAVNLEARGSSGPSLMFETGSANSWLMSLYRSAIARPITDSVYYDAYKALPNSTDFTVFKSAGWQGFNFAFIGDVAHYHTPLDTYEHADLRSIQHQGDNALASTLALAGSRTLRSHPQRDAVYFDLLSRLLIAWPARFSLLISSAALTLLLIEAAVLCRTGRVQVVHIGWGAVGALVCILLGGASSSVILLLLLQAGNVPPLSQYAWIAHPAWMNLTCAALATAAAGLSGHWFARRAGFWGFWLGTLLLFAALGEVLAALRPGLGFVPLLTAVVAVFAILPALRAKTGTRAWSAEAAALAPAWVMFALMIPLISLLYAALGGVAWVIDTLQLSLGATLLLPLLAAASSVLRRRVTGVAAMASIVGVLITLALPTYSAAWPQRLNFRYRMDASTHEAVWLAEPDSLKLPRFVVNAAPFSTTPVREYPDGHRRAFAAPAPSIDLPPPVLTLQRSPASAANATRYDLHLQSPRGAPEIGVVFSASAAIHEIIVNGPAGERRVPLYEAPSGMTHLLIVGVGPAGVDFAVEPAGDPSIARVAPLEAHVFDQSYSILGGEFLRSLRPPEASSSQDGDTTIVEKLVTLHPAAGS